MPDWEPRLGSVVNLETVNGPLPGIRDSQSHLNTPAGRGE